jgi:beta-1,2-mannobiose phosphorylase / 1,2-beta-oligomannan phosphorylase
LREVEGVLNPGIARDRNGILLMYPRKVARGNVSCIGLARGDERDDRVTFERLGVALEPEARYEHRPGGHGCEDARVTFVPRLDSFVMAYTAFGEAGPRIALAVSKDGYSWQRLGLVAFSGNALNDRDNKDAAFFPEPVLSPAGILSFAFYHRPMLPGSVNGQTPIHVILDLDPRDRETLHLGYIPVSEVERDVSALCRVYESIEVLEVDWRWGWLKNGAGTPSVQCAAGWLSFFHGVDAIERDGTQSLLYRAGIVIHDLQRPHHLIYRSPEPLLGPVTSDERFGVVNDVVFPTGLDVRGEDRYDVYYGAADAKISLARFNIRLECRDGVLTS